MSNGDVQREVKTLKVLEAIEGHLATLVDLALASGLASSVEREDTRDERVKSRQERSDIKEAIDSRL